MKPTRIKTMALTGLVLALPAFLTGCPEVVIFPDESLEVAVRSALRQPLGFITVDDMKNGSFTVLSAPDSGITDLRGLEYATNLQFLDLSNEAAATGGIKNIDAIATLVNLRILDLRNNSISDITPIEGLFNLDQLYLHGNEVYNLTALRANASGPQGGAGGLGPGDTVTLNGATLFDDAGETGPQIAEDIGFLLDRGVDVIIITGGTVMTFDDGGIPVSQKGG